MGMTIAEKIIARSANLSKVKPNEIVTCNVDIAMIHDSSGPRRQGPRLKELGVNVWDKEKVVVISDHYVPAVDSISAKIQKITRDWVKEQKMIKSWPNHFVKRSILINLICSRLLNCGRFYKKKY